MDNLVNQFNLNKKVPIIYRHIHKRIINREFKFVKDIPIEQEEIDRKTMVLILIRSTIPSILVPHVLDEMEHYGLIEIKSQRVIRILREAK